MQTLASFFKYAQSKFLEVLHWHSSKSDECGKKTTAGQFQSKKIFFASGPWQNKLKPAIESNEGTC
jgi:hypothetical protein